MGEKMEAVPSSGEVVRCLAAGGEAWTCQRECAGGSQKSEPQKMKTTGGDQKPSSE